MEKQIEKDFKNATLEAIYWWNRDESYYHKHFGNFENIYSDKLLLEFFITKIFEIFLREYSIRRNIKKEKTCKRSELEYYTEFIKQTKIQILKNSNNLKKQMRLLENFKETVAYQFFSKNPKAFERRIYDKYLWIMEQNKNENGRKINNDGYLML